MIAKKLFKGMILGFAFFTALFLLVLIFSVWFYGFDVIGLKFYDDEPIKDFYIAEDRFIIITEEGHGYITTTLNPQDRRHVNSQMYFDDRFNTYEPVLFFEGKIKKVFLSDVRSDTVSDTADNAISLSKDTKNEPFGDVKKVVTSYATLDALFTTENDELYSLKGIKANKICDNISFATYAQKTEKIYAINNNSDLLMIDQNGIGEVICSAVSAVDTYSDRVLVMTTAGDLCELTYNTNSSAYELSAPLYSGVKRFEVVYYASHTAPNLPMISVLTRDNDLYVKGIYNSYSVTPGVKDSYELIDDWTLLSENVTDFATSISGTVFALADGTVHYYGYDVGVIEGDIERRKLPSSNAKRLGACDRCVIVIDENNKLIAYGRYISNPILRSVYKASIFEEDPLIIELP